MTIKPMKYKEEDKQKFLYRTYSGIYVDLNNPLSHQIQIEDIAHHLSNNNRWLGASSLPVSIAVHSLVVMQIVGDLLKVKGFLHNDKEMYLYKLCGLLHDASEAYLGDIPKPLKNLLRCNTNIYKTLEDKFDKLIFNRFSIPFELESNTNFLVFPDEIKIADRVAAIVENLETRNYDQHQVVGFIDNVKQNMSEDYVKLFCINGVNTNNYWQQLRRTLQGYISTPNIEIKQFFLLQFNHLLQYFKDCEEAERLEAEE